MTNLSRNGILHESTRISIKQIPSNQSISHPDEYVQIHGNWLITQHGAFVIGIPSTFPVALSFHRNVNLRSRYQKDITVELKRRFVKSS